MSLIIYKEGDKILLEYSPDNGTDWIDEDFDKDEEISIKRTFSLSKENLVQTEENLSDNDNKQFIIGNAEGDYYKIYKEILMTDNDVLFHINCSITTKYFIVNKNVSILSKFEKLAKQQIVIGGELENAIPEPEFKRVINSFPTNTELNYYADSRITNVISQYLNGVKDSGKAFEKYLEKRNKIANTSTIPSIKSYELDKYTFILETLKEMLKNSDSYSESDWQTQILEIILILYPKYIRCFSNVMIKDFYTKIEQTTNRYIDLMLVDSNGNVDVIEIKKPFDNCVITSNTYRDNYTPLKELSGTIMQVEKYLFHLNKWGVKGERELSTKYESELPNNLKIQITNPKGIVILGRDNNLHKRQLFDLEIIKRKYANVMDIITYDDLIKRLENTLEKFK
ncbi:MAG: DUF4263 domain-containing protein [Bacteroidales bacterium]|nr:DUF4263 domain-containing protein [Bacteroidales bacterium]